MYICDLYGKFELLYYDWALEKIVTFQRLGGDEVASRPNFRIFDKFLRHE